MNGMKPSSFRCVLGLALVVTANQSTHASEPLRNVATIAAGGDNSCVVDNDHYAACWGRGQVDVYGVEPNIEHRIATRVDTLRTPVKSVAIDAGQACAVTMAGGVLCWGKAFYNTSLGDGTNQSSDLPVTVLGLDSGVDSVDLGGSHSCALTEAGGVKCWGSNARGQLGVSQATAAASNVPVDVVGLSSGVVQLSVGQEHNCVVTDAHAAKCWGYNAYRQLGSDAATSFSAYPIEVTGLASGVASVYAGNYHSCAVLDDKTVKCWGDNVLGEAVPGDESPRIYSPTTVVGVANAESLALGQYFSCALISGGSVKCWGWNGDGQLGTGVPSGVSGVVDVGGFTHPVVSIAAGSTHLCALLDDGYVQCVGDNEYGQAGDDSSRPVSSIPVAITGLESGAKDVSAGKYHSCAVTAAGGVKCWGWGGDGQLGSGANELSISPVDVVGLDSGVMQVAAGGQLSCALTELGAVKCWGGEYILGTGSIDGSNVPVDVSGLSSGVEAISAGNTHACARLVTGELRCWGDNPFGALGLGSAPQTLEPSQVAGFGSGALGVDVSLMHTCSVDGDGAAFCWGNNTYGQTGAPYFQQSESYPQPVFTLGTGISQISAGGFHSCALDLGGSVSCWGFFEAGRLGVPQASEDRTYVPQSVTQLASGNLQVSAGGYHTCVLSPTSGLKCFGSNTMGQLGNASFDNGYTAIDVVGQTSGIQKVSSGLRHTCSLSDAGAVTCWGWNSDGQIGDNAEPGFRALPVTVLAAPTPLFISGFE